MANTLLQWEQLGWIRTMQPNGTAREGECRRSAGPEIILMGSGITDAHGRWTLTVNDVICPTLNLIDWVSLVATPSLPYNWSDNDHPDTLPPFPPLQAGYVTTAWYSKGNTLILYVQSWQANGEPKGSVPFSWHAAVIQTLGQSPQT
jgi:hypothetical protein